MKGSVKSLRAVVMPEQDIWSS